MDKVYVVVSNSDLTEGRGKHVFIAYCSSASTAKRLARKKGVMGSDAEVREVNLTAIGSTLLIPVSFINLEYPTREDEAEQKRLDALSEIVKKAKDAGLSDEEIKSLQRG